jgi:peptidoglycan hydrolase-like protein with peptidoglycan-binding domain
MAILQRGLAGEPVKILQRKLGVPDDGQFGPGTEKALKEYQQKNGLQVDGIAGPDTFAQMGLYELVLLKVGTRGTTVKKMQEALGISADGQFGPGTAKAVKDFQAKNGLDADGMAGPATLAKMSLFKEMTADVVKRSEVSASAAATAGATASTTGAAPEASVAPPKSIWGTIKSFFGS